MTYTSIVITIVIMMVLTIITLLLIRKAKLYITESLTDIKRSQSACQAALVHINLPQLIERVNDHEISIRGIGQLEHMAKRMESNAEIYKDVIIQSTDRVDEFDLKLTDMATTLKNDREAQSNRLKGICDWLKRHDKAFKEMEAKIIKIERDLNENRCNC